MKTELLWHFGKYTHFWDPRLEKSRPYFYSFFFFLLLTFSLLSFSQTHSTAFFFSLFFSFFLSFFLLHKLTPTAIFFFFFILFLSFILHKNTWVTLLKTKQNPDLASKHANLSDFFNWVF